MVVSSCAAIMKERPGIMGRPVPGHQLEILDKAGRALPPGEIGTIAVQRPDPVMFINYWNNEKATAEKFIGLIRHPAVQLAGVVGKPDPDRTEIVKAYIVLNEGFAPNAGLAGEITGFVKVQLSAHEYPREIAFVDSLPLTTTGKIIRRELRERARKETE